MQTTARTKMRRTAAAMAAMAAILLSSLPVVTGPAQAAEPAYRQVRERTLPFPRSERAQSVWASGVCWSECGSYTAWNLVACLERDSQGRCLKRTDAADRACQRECRTSGGPLLPLDF